VQQNSKPIQESSPSADSGASATPSLAQRLRQRLAEFDSLPPEEQERLLAEERALAKPISDFRPTLILRPKRRPLPPQ